MPLQSKPKLKTSALRVGDVVTIFDKNAEYITACGDKRKVTWEKEIQGSTDNPQHWTLLEGDCNREPLGECCHLNSIYGKLLSHDRTEGMCQKNDQFTEYDHDSCGCGHWRLNKASKTFLFHDSEYYPDEEGHCANVTMPWDIQVVDGSKNTIPQNKYKVMIYLSNKVGSAGGGGGSSPSGPSSLYNTGRNVNGSGTQETGEVSIGPLVAGFDRFYFQFIKFK